MLPSYGDEGKMHQDPGKLPVSTSKIEPRGRKWGEWALCSVLDYFMASRVFLNLNK